MKLVPLLAAVLAAGSVHADVLGSAFTFQGQLTQNGTPSDGTVDLAVEPFGSVNGSDSLAPVLVLEDVPVAEGLFTVDIDFGPGFFVGDAVWLQIGVREGDQTGAFEPLSPRQELTATPHAQLAQAVAINGIDGDAVADGTLGADDVDAGAVQLRIDDGCGASDDRALTGVAADGTGTCRRFWRVGGNAVADGDFIGVTNGEPLRLQVAPAGQAARNAVRYETVDIGETKTVNVIAGTGHALFTARGVTLAGGADHYVTNSYPTIAGGWDNTARTFGFVGGGEKNEASGQYSVAVGGFRSAATGTQSVVAGGHRNQARASSSAVLGGFRNAAMGILSVVAGGSDNEAIARDSAVLGGTENVVSEGGEFGLIAGGDSNLVEAYYGAIGGGLDNQVSGRLGAVPGGYNNTAGGNSSLAAGRDATAAHDHTFVWSDGSDSFESTATRQFLVQAGNGLGVNENRPQAGVHVRETDLAIDPAGLREEDFMAEDDDAIIGLYSNPAKTYGSGVVLGEIDASGGLVDKWTMVRETTEGSGDSDLRFTYGTSENYGANNTRVRFTEDGRAFKGDNSSSWNTTSDRRIKTEVRTVTSALDRIRALRPVSYRFTPEYLGEHPGITDQRRLSVVAQEYAEVFPNAVTAGDEYVPGAEKTEANRIRQVDLHPAMVTTVAAVQELAAQLEALRERIDELEAENRALRSAR
jgi:hypothetical protein